jgi:hypothetical protein
MAASDNVLSVLGLKKNFGGLTRYAVSILMSSGAQSLVLLVQTVLARLRCLI